MQVTITIPTPAPLLRSWRWALLAALAAAVALLPRPGHVSASDVAAVSAGAFHTCALTTAGGLKCWGHNFYGQLGDGTISDRTTAVDVSGMTSGVAAASAGHVHTCALTTPGGLKCWGRNFEGQLGDGTGTGSTTPVDVSGLTSGVAAVATGDYHTCALTTGGGLKCWGLNDFGQLGDGTNAQRDTPVDVSGLASGVAAVAAGGFHTCALTTAGGLKCWGKGSAGELGDGTTTSRTTAVDVSGLTSGVAAVAAGRYHTCALTTAGGLKCWGDNIYGQVGDGTQTGRSTPVDVSGLTSGVAAVAGGYDHTCALTSAGGLKCWGDNLYGQLGDGTKTMRTAPVDVSGLTSGVAALAADGYHTCAVTTAGGLKCWGYNFYGQLGDGSTTLRTAPVDVSGLGPKGPSEINITNLGQYALPKTCFEVRDAAQTPLFVVCDNNFQGTPAAHAACVPDGLCNDEDPAQGLIRVTVAPGMYHVLESKPPPEHSPDPSKQPCSAVGSSKCELTFVNTPRTQPWHPWDVTGDGLVRIDDILAVVNHYFQDKPLP